LAVPAGEKGGALRANIKIADAQQQETLAANGAAVLNAFREVEVAVYRENLSLAVEFRVVQLGEECTIVSYGFKGTALKDIKKVALEYRNATARNADVSEIEKRQSLLDYHLAQDSFNDYLQYACPVDLARNDAEVCRTHPQYFIWPSDRFFIHYRPQ
jgi:hypothetical protein